METEYVLVDTISMFRMRYCFKVPKGKSEWALDSVTCNEMGEFSQKHLDEVISAHRVVSAEEVVNIFKDDNNYLSRLSSEEILDRFVSDISTSKGGK